MSNPGLPDTAPAHPSDEAALVRLLLTMTIVTGIVDAVSILSLDHVFVANMTGNVVFLAFGVAGAKGFSISASLVALGAFVLGAAATPRLVNRAPQQTRARTLGRVVAVEAALCAGATLAEAIGSGTAARYATTVLLAVAMGAQNAIVRRLAVPDLTTTVLTLTLTGLAGDHHDLGEPSSHSRRRIGAVVAMFVGAVAGALLVLHASTAIALSAATALLIVVSGVAFTLRGKT